MEVAVAESYVQAAQPFVDGFGERRVIVDARGERLDVLRLNTTLSAVPHSRRRFASGPTGLPDSVTNPIRACARSRIDRPTGTLLVISDHVRGARLSTLLACAEKRAVPVEIPAIGCLIRQLVHAAAAWREQMPDAVHGAIGPDRIMITPEGPADSRRAGPRIGPRTTSLLSAAVLGRTGRAAAGHVQRSPSTPVRTFFRWAPWHWPSYSDAGCTADDRLDQIQPTVADRLPPPLRTMDAARRCSGTRRTRSHRCIDARAALDEALGEAAPGSEQDGLLLFMARCLALDVTAPPFARARKTRCRRSGRFPTTADDLPDVDLGTRIEALRAFLARALRALRNRTPLNHDATAPPVSQPVPRAPRRVSHRPPAVSPRRLGTASVAQLTPPLKHPLRRPAATGKSASRV